MDWATQGLKKKITRKYARIVGEKELNTKRIRRKKEELCEDCEGRRY